jgi:hypothetical protein
VQHLTGQGQPQVRRHWTHLATQPQAAAAPLPAAAAAAAQPPQPPDPPPGAACPGPVDPWQLSPRYSAAAAGAAAAAAGAAPHPAAAGCLWLPDPPPAAAFPGAAAPWQPYWPWSAAAAAAAAAGVAPPPAGFPAAPAPVNGNCFGDLKGNDRQICYVMLSSSACRGSSRVPTCCGPAHGALKIRMSVVPA